MPDEWGYRGRGYPDSAERDDARYRAQPDDARYRTQRDGPRYRADRDDSRYRATSAGSDERGDPFSGYFRGEGPHRGGLRPQSDARHRARPAEAYGDRPDAWPRQPPPGARQRAPARRSGRWGSMPFRDSVTIMIASALLGIIATMVAGGGPGMLLGLIVIAGTVAAGTAVLPRASHLIIPLPALTLLVSAMLAGVLGGASAGTSRLDLGLAALQWLAHEFRSMVAATFVAAIIAGIRWWHELRGGP